MNYYLLVTYIIVTVLIYLSNPPLRRGNNSKLGVSMGMALLVTSVLHLLWIVMSWIGVSILSFLTRLF